MTRVNITKDNNDSITICIGEDYSDLILTRSVVWKPVDFNESEIFFRDSDQSKDSAIVFSNLGLKLRIEITDPTVIGVINKTETEETLLTNVLEERLFKVALTKIVESGQLISFLSIFANTFYNIGEKSGRKTVKEMISNAIGKIS